MFKPTRLAIAQISLAAGNTAQNTKKIIKYIKKVKEEGAKIIIFPELTIPGYMAMDLILYPRFIEQNIKALDSIIRVSKDVMVIVGFINQDKHKIRHDGMPVRYNSVAIIKNQKVIALQNKTLLPDYDVFFENRYFSPGRNRKLIDFLGFKIGVEICEDLWDKNYPIKVSKELINKGAEILINISGSPFYIGKRFEREELIRKISKKFKVPFIYVNTVGSQDGYDGELIFDGQSMVFNNRGQLIKLGKEFTEELFYVEFADLFNTALENNSSTYAVTEEIFNSLVLSVKEYFQRTGFKKAFIGLSGGIDSALVAVIAVKALGKNNVTLINMPSPYSATSSLTDAKKLAENLNLEIKIVPIVKLYRNFLNVMKKQFEGLGMDSTEENIQARIRGMILMAYANKFQGLVITTANKTEIALGYTTLYGDMCGAIAPLSDISKLRVYELCRFINRIEKREIIPENIIKKIPSAELKENQTDEDSLGGSYEVISPMVDELIEESRTTSELSKRYPKKLVKQIVNMIGLSEYKRRQAVPGVKITKKAFGMGRRIPISHKFIN